MMADEGRLDAEGTPIGTQSMWVADLIAGVGTALGVVGAVHHHARTGEGQLVDASLLRGAMAAIGSSVMREPVSDAVFGAPAFERVRGLIEDGAGFAEVTDAWGEGSPLRQLGAVRRLYQSVYMAKDGPLVLGRDLARAPRGDSRRPRHPRRGAATTRTSTRSTRRCWRMSRSCGRSWRR